MQPASDEKWLVCRLCLQQPKEKMVTIFNENDEKDLTRVILECGGVPIKKYDHFPDKICESCLKSLKSAQRFRLTCQSSYRTLSRFIAPVKIEKTADTSLVATQSSAATDRDTEEDGGHSNHGIPTDYFSEGTGSLCEEDGEVLHLKLESNIVKSEEFSDHVEEEGEVVEIYEPMAEQEDIEAIEEFEAYGESNMSDEVEYLEDGADVSSDEEFILPIKSVKRRVRAIKAEAKHRGQDQNEEESMAKRIGKTEPNASGAHVTNSNKKVLVRGTSKRGRKPKNADQDTSYICDVCGNIYPSQGRLNEHRKVHNGIKPHECEICGHAFAQTQQLARHMNTHTGNRPYKCQYCPSAFADLSTRNKHHRIHTNERPYVCDVCGKAFTYTNTLKFHKMIHTGEKPHVCDICGKGFLQAYKLRNHKVTHAKKAIKIINVDEHFNESTEFEVQIAAEQIMEL